MRSSSRSCIAPVLFKCGRCRIGAKLIRAIYPRYYIGGAIAGAVALPAFVAGPLCFREYRGAMVGVQALVIIFGILLMLYGANSLTPAIGAAKATVHSTKCGSSNCSAGRLGLDILVFWSSAFRCWLPS